MHEDLLGALLLPTNTTAAKLSKSLNDYISRRLNRSFCVRVYTHGVAAMTGQLSGLIIQTKKVAFKCKSTKCFIHKEMLAI